MAHEITRRQLRNDSGQIMRGLDRGESFVVTRNGVPVGELRPIRRRRFVPKDVALAVFSGAARLDHARLHGDIDAIIDQDPFLRA